MTRPDPDRGATDTALAKGQGTTPSPVGEGRVPEGTSVSGEGEPPWGLSFYLFVEPFAAGKIVVDLSAGGGPGSELLRRSLLWPTLDTRTGGRKQW